MGQEFAGQEFVGTAEAGNLAAYDVRRLA
jgi:hypothetical protein